MKIIYRKDVSCVIGYIMLLTSVHATLTQKPEDSIICPESKEIFLSCTTDNVGLQIKFRPSSPPNADFRFAYIDASSVTGFSASANSTDKAAELTINTPSSDFAGTYTCEDIGGTGDKAEAKVVFIQSNNCSIEHDAQEKTKSKVCCVVKYTGGIVPNAYLKYKDNCPRLTDSQTVEGGIKICGSILLTNDPVNYSAFLSASTSECPVPKEQIKNCNWKEYKSVSLHQPQGSSADKTKGSIIGGMIFIYLFTAALFY